MNKDKKNGMFLGFFVGVGAAFLVFLFLHFYLPSALISASGLTANSPIMQAQIYKYVNVSDLRVNNQYFYPNNCINYKTVYTENNATTPAYISSVIIGNDTASEGFISVPYIINGSVYEFHYIISCR